MPNYTDPRCTECGLLSDRLLLMIKIVSYAKMSDPRKTVKSRSVAWLCPDCLDSDEDWHRPAFSGPGHTSASQERIKARRENQ